MKKLPSGISDFEEIKKIPKLRRYTVVAVNDEI